MSERAEIASVARASAVDAVWRQWAALRAPVTGVAATAVVDPEALLLLSCALRDSERRLDDVLTWWARAGAALLSVQRVRTMARAFPESSRAGLMAFARAAAECGDTRWKSLGAAVEVDALVSRGKRGNEPDLSAYPSLMLRLRAAFSVGVKADVLAVLVAMGGADATVRGLVQATGYTPAAVRRAVQEMHAALVVRTTSHRPATYHIDISVWASFLDLEAVEHSGWRYFAGVFAFLAAVVAWGEEGTDNGYVAASAARDIFEAHRFAFEINRISFPEPDTAPGARYLRAFGDIIPEVDGWLARNL
ncbi:MAG TPA: hypothetical protein VEX86_08945 [Longimicrobium sp.]|nr:hypothetical protein [Longimicrobium sp.]